MNRDVLSEKLRIREYNNMEHLTPEEVSEFREILFSTQDKTITLSTCMEELAELIQQVSKVIRGSSDELLLLEEIADAEEIIGNLKCLLNLDEDKIKHIKEVKYARYLDKVTKNNPEFQIPSSLLRKL